MLLGGLFFLASKALSKFNYSRKNYSIIFNALIINCVALRLYNDGSFRLYFICTLSSDEILWMSTLGCSSNKPDIPLSPYVEKYSPSNIIKFKLTQFKFQLQLVHTSSVIWTNRQGTSGTTDSIAWQNWWDTNPSQPWDSTSFTLILTSPNKFYELRLYDYDLIVYNIETLKVIWNARLVRDTSSSTNHCDHIYTITDNP